MRIIITGGSGFIGTNLVEYYLTCDAEVVNIDISSPRNKKHLKYWEKVNLCDPIAVKNAIVNFNPDYIIHMGARTDLTEEKKIDGYVTNMAGVENLISALRTLTSLKRIIFASSRLVCEIGYKPKNETDYRATTLYGKSKIISEKIIRGSKNIPCSWLIVRPTSIWGPWFDVPYKAFFIAIAKGRYMHPGHRNPLKQLGYVGNTVYELDKLIKAPAESVHGKTIYLADYPPIRLRDWADTIQKSIGAKEIMNIPLSILRLGGIIGNYLKLLGFKNTPLTSFRVNNIITNMIYDMTPLENIAGMLPYSLNEGVEATAKWLRKQGYI